MKNSIANSEIILSTWQTRLIFRTEGNYMGFLYLYYYGDNVIVLILYIRRLQSKSVFAGNIAQAVESV